MDLFVLFALHLCVGVELSDNTLKTADHLADKPQNVRVRYMPPHHLHQSFLVDGSKEFSYVALQHPASTVIALGYLPYKISETIHRPVRSFEISARVGIMDKLSVKVGIQNAIDGVVKQSVSHVGFMNTSGLRVIYSERLVGTVNIGFALQLGVERIYIVREIELKFSDIRFVLFLQNKSTPRFVQILERYDTVVGHYYIFHNNMTIKPPPPTLAGGDTKGKGSIPILADTFQKFPARRTTRVGSEN